MRKNQESESTREKGGRKNQESVVQRRRERGETRSLQYKEDGREEKSGV